jgi:hypothetical protein
MSARSSDEGYTLVEALASLTLLGLASLLLVSGLQTASLRLSRPNPSQNAMSVEAAQEMLRSRIEMTAPVTVLDTATAQIDFDGRSDELDFSAPPPQSHGPDALYHYRLYVAGNGDLRLDASSDLTLDPSKSISEVVLMHDVATLDLAYFGSSGPPGAPTWSSHWQQAPAPPQLVRIRIAFTGSGRRRWPTLIVHPAATLDSGCVIDSSSGTCQGRT